MNPYEAPEPCTDEKSNRGIYDVLIVITAISFFGPFTLIWLAYCFKKDYPHTTLFEGGVGSVLFVLWNMTIAVIIVTLIPYLLRVICIS